MSRCNGARALRSSLSKRSSKSIMRATVRQLLLASAIGAFAIVAQAQGGATPSSAETTSDQDAAVMTMDGATPPDTPEAASRRAPASVDTTQPEATSSSSSEALGSASGTASMSSGGAIQGAGQTSGSAGGGGT